MKSPTIKLHRHSSFIQWVLVCQFLFLRHVSCLASPIDSHRIRVISTNKNGGAAKILTFDENGSVKSSEDAKIHARTLGVIGAVLPALRSGLRSTFLPSGYPSKIPDGYLRYVAWSWVQDLSTQVRCVLATQRILEGVGVGRSGATALSAMLNFIVRDGCGMAATLIFTASAASRFQSNVKKWKLFADIMVDIGITLEVAAAQVPQNLFLPMICVGNACKAMCGVAGGAVGGPINLYWAAKGTDISEISAKFGAQQTVTASLGLVFAAIFAKSISTFDPKKVWILYTCLTVLHIIANMRCMRIIAFDTLNNGRLEMLFQQFWHQYNTQSATKDIQLFTPGEVASRESLFFLPKFGDVNHITFGVPFNDVVDLTATSDIVQDQTHWLVASELRGWVGRKGQQVKVALHAKATPRQNIEAYFDALLVAAQTNKSPNGEKSAASVDHKAAWAAFCAASRKVGWDLDQSNIRSRGYEIVFDDKGSETT